MRSHTKLMVFTLVGVVACAKATSTAMNQGSSSTGGAKAAINGNVQVAHPSPDPRVGLKPGTMNGARIGTPAAEAIWNMKMVSHTPLPPAFETATTSDLAFSGNNVIQGNYNGFLVWDVSNPMHPTLKIGQECPASQDDVSVFNNLLFVSSESNTGRLDCGKGGAPDAKDRIRGVRIFDITDITHPKPVASVQTCRGSHTHTVVTDPNDPANVYIYISGTSGIRGPEEVPGCINDPNDPNTSQFKIEVIRVPLAHPEQSKVVSAPAIFAANGKTGGLVNPGSHAAAPTDTTAAMRAFNLANAQADSARLTHMLDSLKAAGIVQRSANIGMIGAGGAAGGGRGGRGGRGGGGGGGNPLTALSLQANATAADTARAKKTLDSLKTTGLLTPAATLGSFRAAGNGRGGNRGGGGIPNLGALAPRLQLTATSTRADTANAQRVLDSLVKAGTVPAGTTLGALGGRGGGGAGAVPRGTLTQCHDITVYPGVGLAGGACAGMGLLLDIHDAAHPTRIDAVADSNFSFWHSATFSNDGGMVLFSDEWGGGGAAYCRATDPKNWGADALFKIVNGKMVFQSYYKMPAAQTPAENCVAHNGSLIPIPGRTIMVQAFYQGGLTMFEWTDPVHPVEIGFFDRGPYAATFVDGGYWSVYWYNGYIYGSEIKRGLDVFELTPSSAISQNEIDAAKTVHFTQLNVQGQPKLVWPASFALARAYADQLERDGGLSAANISSARSALSAAEKQSGAARSSSLKALAAQLQGQVAGATDKARAQWLANAVSDLAK